VGDGPRGYGLWSLGVGVALLAGCAGDEVVASGEGWEVRDAQDVWPDAQQLAGPVWFAADPETLAEGWQRFGLEDDAPGLDLDAQVAFLLDTPAPEDCPRTVTGVTVGDLPQQFAGDGGPRALLEVSALRPADHEEPCAGSPAPSVQVLTVDRELVPEEPFTVDLGGWRDGATAFTLAGRDEPPPLAPHADHELWVDPSVLEPGERGQVRAELGPETEARGDEDHHLAAPTGSVDAELARWGGHQWVASPGASAVSETDSDEVAEIDASELAPGTYRVRLEIEVAGDEFASAQRPAALFEVVDVDR
jgi:hypothetical protein